MKVLIVDVRLDVRQDIHEMVLELFPDTAVSMASEGNQALQMIYGNDFDIIITSNHLNRVFGANLLQAINRKEIRPPTLLHSANRIGYMLVDEDNHQEIDLAEHVKSFPFAQFRSKSGGYPYLRQFLSEIKING